MATFKVDSRQLERWLDMAQNKSQLAVRMYAQEGAKKFENYAKNNRRWTDRTGHARQRLTGWVEQSSTKTRVNIGHGVYYGIYLEMCNERRYEILQPTVNNCSREVLKGFANLMRYLT